MLAVTGRVAHHLLREAAPLAGRADQDIAFESIDDFCEVPAISPGEPDFVQPLRGPCEFALVTVEIVAVLADDTAAVQRDDRAP